MRVRTFRLLAAVGASLLGSVLGLGGAGAQSGAPALERTDHPSRSFRRDGRGPGQRPDEPVADHHHGRERPERPLQLPGGKLAPGHYSLRIRATGYELDGPQAVDVAPDQTANVDLKLRKAADLAAQLTNTEWFMSFPGTAEQKRPLIECMSCHTLERVARSKFSADEFMPVLKRMTTYANNTIQARPQRARRRGRVPAGARPQGGRVPVDRQSEQGRDLVLPAARRCRVRPARPRGW